MPVALIAALDTHHAIGRDNALPWHLPDDLQRFKALTLGRTVLMGRKTQASIGRPLPKRRNVVLSRNANLQIPGCEVVSSLHEALATDPDLMVIGGGEVYALALPHATRLHLTLVDTTIAHADAFFPQINWDLWQETARTHHAQDERHAHPFDFVDFERKPKR